MQLDRLVDGDERRRDERQHDHEEPLRARQRDRVEQALEGVLGDERGRWLLSHDHDDVRSEYPVSHVFDGKVRHMVIDRTFIDSEGTRWIIDYKTGMHSGGGLDEFLDREQERYRQQMEWYARAMKFMDDRPVKLALYFPLMQGWREWVYSG